MNRPRRPNYPPPRRRPSGPPSSTPGGGGPPRRRSALDLIPQNVEPRFEILGSGVDRQALLSSAQPLELVVVQGFTREIEDVFQGYKGRPDEFWIKNAGLLETARKLDEVLVRIQERKAGG
jgi:hypothetical protein